jgi:hypothetical protein
VLEGEKNMANNVFELFVEDPIFAASVGGFIVGCIIYVFLKLVFF